MSVGAARSTVFVVGLLVMLALLGAEPSGQVQAAETGFIFCNGTPVVRAELHYEGGALPVSLAVDLGLPVPLMLHQKMLEMLKLSSDAAVTISTGDMELKNLPIRNTDLSLLEQLSKDYATELDEIPVGGLLGLTAFADAAVEMDTGTMRLRLLPADVAQDISARDIVVPFEVQPAGYFIAGSLGEDFAVRVRWATLLRNTLIDSLTADLAGAPAGDVEQLLLADLDVTQYVPLRPVDMTEMFSEPPDVMLGTNLLASLKVVVDPFAKQLVFTPIAPIEYAAHERDYYAILYDEDADALTQWLDTHGETHFGLEAALNLLQWRLDELPPEPQDVAEALQWRVKLERPNRRAQMMVNLSDTLIEPQDELHDELARLALEAGWPYAADDLNARASYDIQARRGYLAMRQGDLVEARRQLLSAAFGLSRDPRVNFWLGELYEKMGKSLRAWSRYVQATLDKDDPVAEAYDGLNRLLNDAAFRKSFSMHDAELLLEGRTLGFHPAGRFFEDAAEGALVAPKLIELFTSVDVSGAAPAELAFAGLAEYYEDQPVVFVSYHLADAAPDPLAVECGRLRAKAYGIEQVPTLIIDGGTKLAGLAGAETLQQLYDAYQQASLDAAVADQAWSIRGAWQAEPTGAYRGELIVSGPGADEPLNLHAVLCERRVFVPSAGEVLLHPFVARANLMDDSQVINAGEKQKQYTLTFNVPGLIDQLRQSIETQEQEKGVSFLVQPRYIDPAESMVVVWLQSSQTHAVLASSAFVLE